MEEKGGNVRTKRQNFGYGLSAAVCVVEILTHGRLAGYLLCCFGEAGEYAVENCF